MESTNITELAEFFPAGPIANPAPQRIVFEPSRRIPAGARQIFIEFLAREGWHRRDAAHEFDEFLSCNGWARRRDSYLTIRRTGARNCITRAQRQSIYETFLNSFNHATFEA